MPKTKYKRLTAAEKKFNKIAKQELINNGVIPPSKKPLNRKKLNAEVHSLVSSGELNVFRLQEAIAFMLPLANTHCKITAEEVGILKLIRVAVELERFWSTKHEAGETSATYEELFAAINPILEL